MSEHKTVAGIEVGKRYSSPELPGFAVWVLGWEVVDEPCRYLVSGPDEPEQWEEDWSETTRVEFQEGGRVRVCCVGDERVHLVERAGLRELEEGEFCWSCGQVGCRGEGLGIEVSA